ncbi:diguanylate cyclase domain-containing protein [Sphingomonas sp. Root50]|uniref:sensor domain-containing diguanylate cyclase n=1 Tax=Sphingomonas sp. Root50 TaxID=1736551 RepID=UPI001F4537F7|nr:diguanylate cyclase [Sphingomonas sp. Root50]
MPSFTAARRSISTPLLAALLYSGLGIATIHLTGDADIASVWPANAVLVALLVLRRPSEWTAILVAGFVGNVLANLCTRGTAEGALLFGPANFIEVVIAAWGIRRRLERSLAEDPSGIWPFIFWAGLVAPFVGALVGAGTMVLFRHQPFGPTLLNLYVANALGLLICTPVFYGLFKGEFVHAFREKTSIERVEAVALLALTSLVATLVFMKSGVPFLFLLFIPMMLVTFRVGWQGSKIAVLIIAAIGGFATMNHQGPVTFISPNPGVQATFFQFFLASVLLVNMPVAAAVAARKILIERLRDNERSLRLIVSQSPTLLLHFTPAGICDREFGSSEILFGQDAGAFVGSRIEALSATAAEAMRDAHLDVLADAVTTRRVEFLAANGLRWLEATFGALRAEDGDCVGTLASIHDITARKHHAAFLTQAAETDSLTGLYNRAGFLARLDAAVEQADSGALSVAMIDVDRFKGINDGSGHNAGDIVLHEIARRIGDVVGTSGTVGRLGGDEFALLLAVPERAARRICASIVAAVGEIPVVLPSGGTIPVTISCGIAPHRSGFTASRLLHAADEALYTAKRGGRNRFQTASPIARAA